MDEAFDRETGEVEEVPVSGRALAAAREERRERREEVRGVGKVSIYAKLARAYTHIQPILKNNKLEKDKPGQRGNYTSYDRIIKIVQPVLLREGIIIRHNCGFITQHGEAASKTYWLPVNTYLIDVDTGEVLETTIPLPIARPDPHALGAAVLYGKRYGILSALGFATGDDGEDDDAQSAMPRELEVEGPADKLIREAKANKTIEAFMKWRDSINRQYNQLSDEDQERVKVEAMKHRDKLAEAEDANQDRAPAKSKKKVETASQ